MAKELNINTGVTGQTVTANPFLFAVAQNSISMTEYGATGVYWGDMEGAAGTYEVIFTVDGTTKGSGQIVWDGTNEVVARVTLVDTCTKNTDMRGTDNALLASTAGEGLTALGDIRMANLDVAVSSISGALTLEQSNMLTDLHNEAFGKWVVDPVGKTLTLYNPDNSILKVFDLADTSASVPAFISRTPQ